MKTRRGSGLAMNLEEAEQSYVCKWCKSRFIPRIGQQRYCSKACSKAYHSIINHSHGRFVILERDKFRCAYCGHSSFENAAKLHLDHVIPEDKGGGAVAGNLITTCERCNVEKSTMRLQNESELLAEVAKRNDKRDIPQNMAIRLPSAGRKKTSRKQPQPTADLAEKPSDLPAMRFLSDKRRAGCWD